MKHEIKEMFVYVNVLRRNGEINSRQFWANETETMVGNSNWNDADNSNSSK